MVAGSLEAAAAAVAGSLVEEAVAGNLVAAEAGPLAVRAVAGVGEEQLSDTWTTSERNCNCT